MSLTRAQVEGIAHLARLEITEAQMPVYVDSLSRIIDLVEQLAAADTAGVEPMAHPLADQVQRLRADEVTESDRHDKYQRNASAVAAGLYLVPKVLD
jgi:aspartyl-tRNA(Asn)/glutamyl-tRNA(Gln) amidotransferase subunit C